MKLGGDNRVISNRGEEVVGPGSTIHRIVPPPDPGDSILISFVSTFTFGASIVTVPVLAPPPKVTVEASVDRELVYVSCPLPVNESIPNPKVLVPVLNSILPGSVVVAEVVMYS